MKKFIAVICFLILSFSAFAGGDVSEIDGYFWINLSPDQKIYTVFGYLVAMSTTIQFSIDSYGVALAQPRTERSTAIMEMLKAMESWSIYPVVVSVIVEDVNKFYSVRDNLSAPLRMVIPFLYDKQWWD